MNVEFNKSDIFQFQSTISLSKSLRVNDRWNANCYFFGQRERCLVA